MNCEVTVAGMAAPAPRVKGNTNAAHHTARFVLPARMPLLFPAHQVGSNGQFFAINILARLGDVEILAEELDRVHVSLAARSSSAHMVRTAACGWLGARQARAGPMLLRIAVCCLR